MSADALEAVIEILKADAGVNALVSTRVFGNTLPEDEASTMPRKSVVLASSGGAWPTFAQGDSTLAAQRFDMVCYGENHYEAERVRRGVYDAMRGINRVLQSGVLVHWAQPAGGATAVRDSDANWAAMIQSWQVMFDERDAA